ncbi:MAG: 16S rRNA (guanine(527)-N(7))-methyltransferase RsmG [candidate division WOR-3 bacterium]|nr:16S rRNA (guanine(527)-N(7))-methyltransferase RsmG [candidate division WOR-3 bacterium]MCX7757271.1 16S rRNA (guanine(527)-N(7))-methyltransferase RsmG [candidate division WOR-3 bacterium]MDW7988252.1 16S rRNA (guanine(527)-N(7))-methyltransferase RsmG [candidate division WOR-3 bacterium]
MPGNTEYEILENWCKELNLNITSEAINKFKIYAQLINEWNKKINLVSRKDISRIVSYHFVDSVSSVFLIPYNTDVADLGSGAGLPGIPIKIVRPDLKLTLIESIKKKAQFLNEVVKTLCLDNTQILSVRAELISELQCDIILVRLVGKIKDILQIANPLLRPQGRVIFYKSKHVDYEIEEAQKIASKMHYNLNQINEVKLPNINIIRKFVIYTKVL